MAAPTQYYVNPADNDDNGDGSVGDPWGDLEFALESITPSADGDQINIKTGSTETLENALDIVNDYGTPTIAAPLTFRGYTTAANDGGIGIISGGGLVAIHNSTSLDFINFVDLRLTNCGANKILQFNDDCCVVNCEIDTASGSPGVDSDGDLKMVNCYLHGLTGAIGLQTAGGGLIYGNLFVVATTTTAIQMSSGFVIQNVIKVTDNGSYGIRYGDNSYILGNSIFSTAGTKAGITGSAAGRDLMVILNNIVEGWIGTGGAGYEFSSTDHATLWGYNAAFNNTDNVVVGDVKAIVDIGGDDIPLAASAFADPSSLDFSVGTEVKATAMPNFVGGGTTPGTTQFLDMGAAQREEAGGGGDISISINSPMIVSPFGVVGY